MFRPIWLIGPKLAEAQRSGDAITALGVLKEAFTTDVSPILAAAREREGGAIDPIAAYRASGYRARKRQKNGRPRSASPPE